jgi:hypothetical protein
VSGQQLGIRVHEAFSVRTRHADAPTKTCLWKELFRPFLSHILDLGERQNKQPVSDSDHLRRTPTFGEKGRRWRNGRMAVRKSPLHKPKLMRQFLPRYGSNLLSAMLLCLNPVFCSTTAYYPALGDRATRIRDTKVPRGPHRSSGGISPAWEGRRWVASASGRACPCLGCTGRHVQPSAAPRGCRGQRDASLQLHGLGGLRRAWPSAPSAPWREASRPAGGGRRALPYHKPYDARGLSATSQPHAPL